MKPSKAPKQVQVISNQQISENIRRVVLAGESLKTLPENCAGDYLKLQFSADGSTDLSSLAKDQHPVMRTYTIREFDQAKGQLSIDFVLHHHGDSAGIASRWAEQASAGDSISIAGPGPSQDIDTAVDSLLYVADMTALPALAAKLAALPADAKGHALVQLSSESDQQSLAKPEGIVFDFIVSAPASEALVEAVTQLPTPQGSAGVWCACEYGQMRAIRRHISDNWSVARESAYFSSYWKQGVSEDGHKALKQKDSRQAALGDFGKRVKQALFSETSLHKPELAALAS